MRARIVGRKFAVVGVTGLLISVGTTFAAPAASAASAGGCVGPVWGLLQQDVCVHVVTGQKKNHKQWVSSIEVDDVHGFGGRLEAWAGAGRHGVAFYRSYSGGRGYAKWTVNQWIKSGSGVCGALDPRYPGDSREVACITIKA